MTRAAELERKINTAMRKQELCKGMAQRITPSLSFPHEEHHGQRRRNHPTHGGRE